MGASSEIRYKIGADTSAFSKSMVALGTIAEGAGRAIERKLGLKDAFKSTVIALGISIDKIAQKIAQIWTGGSQEAWKAGLDAATQTTDLILEKQLARLDTARQIAAIEKEMATNARDLDSTPRKGELPSLLQKLGPNMQRNLRETFGNLGVGGFETQAEAFERSQKAGQRQLVLEEKLRNIKKAGGETDRRVEEAKSKAAAAAMTDEEKLGKLREEAKDIEKEIGAAKVKTAEVKNREIDLANKQAEIAALDLKIQKDKTAELEKQAEATEKFFDEYAKSRQEVASAEERLAQAKRDALAFSLNEASAGKRGTASDRVRARAIDRDEATARRLFDTDGTVTQFENGRNQVRGAEFFQNRAIGLRKSFEKLQSSDRDPFEAATKELKTANRHLERIESQLDPTGVS